MTFCCVLICLSVCLPVSVLPHSFPIGIRIRSCFTHSVPSASLPPRAVFTSLCWPAKRIPCHFLLIASYIESWRGERNAFYFFHGTFYFLLSSLCLCFCHARTHTRVSLWVFSELRPQQFQLCVSLSQDQVTFRYSVAPQRVVYLHFRVCVFRFFFFCFNFTNCRPSLRNC